MSNGKTLTYLGILIAINTAFWSFIDSNLWRFIVINILTILICLFLTYIENKIIFSNHKWIDRIVYKFTKNDFNYIVKQKIVEYSIEAKNKAKYKLSADICVSKNPDENFHYEGRYVWDQEEDINVELLNSKDFYYKASENLKWSNIDIYPTGQLPELNKKYSVGFILDNLYMGKLIKHSFLSCKVIEKIEKLKLIAKVDPSLHPSKKAILEIQNHLGTKVAKDEEILYDESTQSYSKMLTFPRKGRKYIIHWKYEKELDNQ